MPASEHVASRLTRPTPELKTGHSANIGCGSSQWTACELLTELFWTVLLQTRKKSKSVSIVHTSCRFWDNGAKVFAMSRLPLCWHPVEHRLRPN